VVVSEISPVTIGLTSLHRPVFGRAVLGRRALAPSRALSLKSFGVWPPVLCGMPVVIRSGKVNPPETVHPINPSHQWAPPSA